jgi:hypothetical protein
MYIYIYILHTHTHTNTHTHTHTLPYFVQVPTLYNTYITALHDEPGDQL